MKANYKNLCEVLNLLVLALYETVNKFTPSILRAQH